MATTQLTRLRTLKKVEKPRPPKLNQRHTANDSFLKTIDELVSLIDNVTVHLTNGFHDQSLQMDIVTMCNTLKPYALQVEAIYKDQLDRAFVALRNASQDDRLYLTTRVHLLELIELRAKHWRRNDSMDTYYNQKLSSLDNQADTSSMESPTTLLTSAPLGSTSPQAAPILDAGEVLKNSGKFAKPTRIPGKNYWKDEVVIRNSDSGKVMGIKGRRVHMIEELSETIISFQRVNPGAKERLVQITGTSEDKIHYAKDLIKDTIQRNASPVRLEQSGGDKSGIGGSSSSLNSSASDESARQQLQQQRQQTSRTRSTLLHSLSTNDASIGEYKYTVTVGNHSIKVTGSNLDLVRTAKLVLDGYFSSDPEQFNSGVDYFSLEEEASFDPATDPLLSVPLTPMTPLIPLTPITPLTPSSSSNVLVRDASLDGNTATENEETFNGPLGDSGTDIIPKKEIIKLTYEFLLLCSKGPYARRAPEDWARIQKMYPNIVRKPPIRWFEPEAYRAKVAAAGFITLLPVGEADDLE